VTLDEERAALRVETEREEGGGHVARSLAEEIRIVAAREGVVVDDAVDRIELVLEPDVVPDRAEVVAEMGDAGRLDAAERANARGGRHRRRV
jgi:hypothetical protein